MTLDSTSSIETGEQDVEVPLRSLTNKVGEDVTESVQTCASVVKSF